jgi:hypothetical protein
VGTRDALRNGRLHAAEAVRLTTACVAPQPPAAAGKGDGCPNAWALTLLAETAYLHWCAGLGRRVAPGAAFLASPGGRHGSGGTARSSAGDVGWAGRTLPELAAAARSELRASPPAAEGSGSAGGGSGGGGGNGGGSAGSGSGGGDGANASVAAKDRERDAARAAAVVARDATLGDDVALHVAACDRLAALRASAAPAAAATASPSPAFPFTALLAACLSEGNAARLAAQAEAMLSTLGR